jgi:hypothetical protein
MDRLIIKVRVQLFISTESNYIHNNYEPYNFRAFSTTYFLE